MKIVERMSADLKAAFPDMNGWSPRNLKYMRSFADTWGRHEIVQAPLAQLPWYHHITLIEQLKSRGDRIAYAALAVENGWSRNVMVHQIDMKVADQHGKAVTNSQADWRFDLSAWAPATRTVAGEVTETSCHAVSGEKVQGEKVTREDPHF